MGCWSPVLAMEAFMHTLQLCKEYDTATTSTSNLIEPKSMEFIAALAGGNQARLMVDVAPGGLSPSTLAMAVAARHTGGRLICIRDEQEAAQKTRTQMKSFDLLDVVEFEIGNPCEVIKHYKNIDFVVVDHRVKDCLELFLAMDMNPSRSVVVVSNLFNGRRVGTSYGHVVKGRVGVRSVTLPIGGGMEVTRIGRGDNLPPRKFKRTFVVYEN